MDPVLLDVAGPIKLRWYGLGYLLGFVFAYYLLRWQARKSLWVLPENKVSDFITYAAVFGVFIGGRLGSVLIYNFDAFLSDPSMIFKVWDGGMASHGGILGLMIVTFVYARKNNVSWTGVGDGLCVVAPIGIFLVRIANFINGELYGRAVNGVSWAIKFPASLYTDLENDPVKLSEAFTSCQAVDPSIGEQPYSYLVAQARDNPELLETLGGYLKARHPSQLYEALLEGLVLFLILFMTRIKFPKLANGVLTGMFFIFYAVFRIIVEGFREPDSAMIGVFTKGQFYSLFMVIAGLAFLGYAYRTSKKVA